MSQKCGHSCCGPNLVVPCNAPQASTLEQLAAHELTCPILPVPKVLPTPKQAAVLGKLEVTGYLEVAARA